MTPRRTTRTPPRGSLRSRHPQRPPPRRRRHRPPRYPSTATEVVAWINGHPEFTDLPVDLSGEYVVIVGNGNVALDVARILTTDPDTLARPDIADHALATLRRLEGAGGGDCGAPQEPSCLGLHPARTDRPDVNVRGCPRRRRSRTE